MKDCIVHQNGRNESQVCGYVMYPNHPHLSKRNKCNTVLLKKIRVGCKNKLVPRKTFVYNSVIDGLKSLVCRRGFLQKCEHWRQCVGVIPPEIYADIFEGRVWKNLESINQHSFFSQANNLSLMLNIDWFNSYDETPYSAGVILFCCSEPSKE